MAVASVLVCTTKLYGMLGLFFPMEFSAKLRTGLQKMDVVPVRLATRFIRNFSGSLRISMQKMDAIPVHLADPE